MVSNEVFGAFTCYHDDQYSLSHIYEINNKHMLCCNGDVFVSLLLFCSSPSTVGLARNICDGVRKLFLALRIRGDLWLIQLCRRRLGSENKYR